MFCQTCGAENAPKARFCNMCGIPIAEPGAPGGPLPAAAKKAKIAEDASDTIAMPMTPAQAQVIATMAQQAIVEPIESAPSNNEAVTARPSPKNHDAGKTSHGFGLDQPLPEILKEAPLERAEPVQEKSQRQEELQSEQPSIGPSPARRKEETWEKHAAAADSPFATTSSVSLEGLGMPSARRRMVFLLGGGLVLMGAGALFMYLAMKPSDGKSAAPDDAALETAQEKTDMVLGMPLPSDELPVPDAGGTSLSEKASRGKTSSKGSEPTATDKPTKRSSSTGATGTKSSTAANKNARNAQSGSKTNASKGLQKDSSGSKGVGSDPVVDNAESTTGGSSEGATPSEAPAERNLELEMYSSRVRYAVSRYYAGRAQTCFDTVTKNQPDLRGSVQIAFKISQEGQVSGARVTRNTTGHAGLGKCLVSQANAWRLPPPPQPGIELQMPFSR